jgi:hypothetical protein
VDLIQSVGVYATISIEQIGSYAGFAAVLGLAVLSALYFSQARDVRRLREWAGRAPERDAEARARVAAATSAGQQRQAGTAAAQPAAAAAAGAAAAAAAAQPAAAGGNSGGATATPAAAGAKTPAIAASASKAPAVAGGGAAGGGGGRPAVPIRPAGSRPSGATSILTPNDEPRDPWYRRLAPRYIALIVAGVLVVGGGIAVGAVQLLSSNDSGTPSASSGSPGNGQGAQPAKAKTAPIQPGDVSVAVFNATGVNGLANQFGDRAQADGFKKDTVGNAPSGQQRAESVVLYAPGKQREARLVRRKFDVNQMEPVDATSQAQAPQADVILVIGADKTS